MLKTRVIPCLLFKGAGLVKTVKFKDPKYVGDPINAIRIFNEKEVDELIFLDIDASKNGKRPNFDIIKDISSECFMPLCYGGGVETVEDIKTIFSLGVEKVAINSHAIANPDIFEQASKIFGSQSIVASIDVKKNLIGNYRVYDSSHNKITNIDALEFGMKVQKSGAGEIFLNSVDKDGTMEGYDLGLIQQFTNKLSIPIIASGGCGNISHFVDAVKEAKASAVAAGSFFVFHGKHRAVLITYPEYRELEDMLES